MPELTPAEAVIMNELTAQSIVEKAMKASEVKEPPPPPKKTCDIKDMLPPSVAQMVKEFPLNETVRSVVCAHLKKPIPKELETFQQIRDWIETTFSKDSPTATTGIVKMSVVGGDIEYGRCNYRVNRTSRGNFSITEADLITEAQECDGYLHFIDRIKEMLTDDDEGGRSNLRGMEWDGVPAYEEYEDADDSPEEFWIDIDDAGRKVLSDTVKRLAPEKAREWGLL